MRRHDIQTEHVVLIDEAGSSLMLRHSIDHVGFRVSACIHRPAVDVDGENVCGATFGTNGKPSRVVRERYVTHFGGRVASIQRVDVFDVRARALERTRVDVKHVKVLTERVGRDEQTTVRVELERVDGLLVRQEMSNDPVLIFIM